MTQHVLSTDQQICREFLNALGDQRTISSKTPHGLVMASNERYREAANAFYGCDHDTNCPAVWILTASQDLAVAHAIKFSA